MVDKTSYVLLLDNSGRRRSVTDDDGIDDNNNGKDERFPDIYYRKFPEERLKTVITGLLLICAGIFTSASVSFLNEVFPREHPLPDIIFRLIPIQEWAWPLSDLLVGIMGCACGLLILLHRYRWIVLRRAFFIASVLYFLRCLAMLSTWMPLSDRSMQSKCMEPVLNKNDRETNWPNLLKRVFKYSSNFGFDDVENGKVLCGDYIYSGHTLMYVLTTLLIRTYMPRTGLFRLIRILYPVTAACGMICVVISRLHYTIDVFVAYWMTTLTYYSYHALIALPRKDTVCKVEQVDLESGRAGSGKSVPRRDVSARMTLCWTWVVLEFFEKNVPAGYPIPREMQWAYGRPLWLRNLINSLNDDPHF